MTCVTWTLEIYLAIDNNKNKENRELTALLYVFLQNSYKLNVIMSRKRATTEIKMEFVIWMNHGWKGEEKK